MSLKLKTVMQSKFLEFISREDLATINNQCSWHQEPNFPKMGRSAWLELKTPVTMEDGYGNSVKIGSVKIKGVGLLDHTGAKHHPTAQPYNRIHEHVVFNERGKFEKRLSSLDVIGGMTLSRAEAEYKNAEILISNGCPSIFPLYVFCIQDEALQVLENGRSMPLGIVVTAYPSSIPFRLDFPFSKVPDEHSDKWPEAKLPVNLERYFYMAGKTLRSFHESGLYRYSGHLDNFGYSPENHFMFALDLDSSRQMNELDSYRRPVLLIRDIASLIYGTLVKASREENISSEICAKEQVAKLVRCICYGYFNDIGSRTLDSYIKPILESSEDVMARASSYHQQKSVASVRQEASTDFTSFRKNTMKQNWIDRFGSYTLLIAGLRDVFNQSAIGKKYPAQQSRIELVRLAQDAGFLNNPDEIMSMVQSARRGR